MGLTREVAEFAAPCLAAFPYGVAVHADDYDDMQLSSRQDRVCGLLNHPIAPGPSRRIRGC